MLEIGNRRIKGLVDIRLIVTKNQAEPQKNAPPVSRRGIFANIALLKSTRLR
jgi:hypothetical protein